MSFLKIYKQEKISEIRITMYQQLKSFLKKIAKNSVNNYQNNWKKMEMNKI